MIGYSWRTVDTNGRWRTLRHACEDDARRRIQLAPPGAVFDIEVCDPETEVWRTHAAGVESGLPEQEEVA